MGDKPAVPCLEILMDVENPGMPFYDDDGNSYSCWLPEYHCGIHEWTKDSEVVLTMTTRATAEVILRGE